MGADASVPLQQAESVTRRLGLAVPLPGHDLSGIPDLAVLAEDAGFSDFWSSEVAAADGFTPLAAAASRTSSLRLGVSVVPIYTRPAALLGMTAATLQHLSGGRFWLGIGASTPAIVEGWMGRTRARPVATTRDLIHALRLISTSERVDYDGETMTIKGFRLDLPPVELPIVVGAMGPLMVALAGELADGIASTFVRPEGLAQLLAPFWASLEGSGRSAADVEVTCRFWISVDDGDRQTILTMLRGFIARYAAVPPYNRQLAQQGFVDEAAAITDAWRKRDRAALHSAVTDEMILSLNAVGDMDTCLTHLSRLRDAGVTTPIVVPISSERDPVRHRAAIHSMIRGVAEADGNQS